MRFTGSNRRVYLDHNASSPLLPEASAAMALAIGEAAQRWGNPSSPHAFGHEARLELERCREEVGRLIGAAAREILFVSGGTEADNLAIQGVARSWRGRGRPPGHIVTSSVEHPAVLGACRHLAASGWSITILPVGSRGLVDPDEALQALRPDTALMSIMAANNETGVLQPIHAIAKGAREAGVPVHVDAVQAVGRVPLNVEELGADLVSISSHKIGGPVGIGALWVGEGVPLTSLLFGGGQERRLRPGTESPLLACGFAAAARATRERRFPPRPSALRDRLEKGLTDRFEWMQVNGASAPRLPNTSSLTFPGLDNEALVMKLDLLGFAISTGSACSTGSTRPSHVLAAMGLSADEIASTVRVSLGPSTTEAQVDALVEAFGRVVPELASVARGKAVAGRS